MVLLDCVWTDNANWVGGRNLKSNIGRVDGWKGVAQRDFYQIAFSDIHPLVVNLTSFLHLTPT